jgi:glycosyltransferase involved in cell wall biosynthesis
MEADRSDEFGVVAIGRNEGERLKQCLRSASKAALTVYVDSGSTDDSVKWAADFGAIVVQLDMTRPFTAARARNAGFKRLRELAPDLNYVQFIDGDCELIETWSENAISFLNSHNAVCAALGRRRERHPDQSIYNRLCDREWDIPIGEVTACGGDVMLRTGAFEASGGYLEELIAGEEPELCLRLRAAGWKVWRIAHEMTLHDAAMTHFGQWRRRHIRSGYAFAQGAHLHGKRPERHWVWESRRAILWGMGFPIVSVIAISIFGWPGVVVLLIYPLQMLRRMLRMSGPWRSRAQFSFFEVLSRFPEAFGQVKFSCDRLLGRQGRLIEYK